MVPETHSCSPFLLAAVGFAVTQCRLMIWILLLKCRHCNGHESSATATQIWKSRLSTVFATVQLQHDEACWMIRSAKRPSPWVTIHSVIGHWNFLDKLSPLLLLLSPWGCRRSCSLAATWRRFAFCKLLLQASKLTRSHGGFDRQLSYLSKYVRARARCPHTARRRTIWWTVVAQCGRTLWDNKTPLLSGSPALRSEWLVA